MAPAAAHYLMAGGLPALGALSRRCSSSVFLPDLPAPPLRPPCTGRPRRSPSPTALCPRKRPCCPPSSTRRPCSSTPPPRPRRLAYPKPARGSRGALLAHSCSGVINRTRRFHEIYAAVAHVLDPSPNTTSKKICNCHVLFIGRGGVSAVLQPACGAFPARSRRAHQKKTS